MGKIQQIGRRPAALILIFLLAIAARILYLDQIKDDTLFYYPIVDSGTYDYGGFLTAQGEITDEHIRSFHRIPFYRLLLAFIYRTGGYNIYLARFIQAVFGALSCCLISALASLVFSRRAGLISGVTACLYWPFIAFGAKFLPVNLAIFFSLLTVFTACKFLQDKRLIWVFASGVFLAFSCLARANIFLVFPAFFLWALFYFRKKAGTKRGVLYSVIFLVGFLVILTPPLVKDYSERKEFMPVQKNYGVGAYFGSALEHINIKPGSTWRKLMRELLAKGLIRTQERNFYFLNKTKEIILRDPLGYLNNLFEKMYILWNYYEFSPRECINYFRQKSGFLSLPLFNFGSIAAFSILGMFLAWRKSREKVLPVYLFVFIYQISLLPFMPLARYRLPLAGFLIVFASYCISEFFEALRKKQWRSLAKYAAVILPIFILTNTNALREYLEGFSRPHYHEGRACLNRPGEEKDALSEFKLALTKHPNDPDIYSAMGNAYDRIGDLKSAESSYKKAIKIQNRFPRAINDLGVIYAKQGKPEKAKALFMKVLSEFPGESVNAHINLGNCYKIEKKYKMSEKEYKRALFLEPDNMQALYGLALLYEATGNPEADNVRTTYNRLLNELQNR